MIDHNELAKEMNRLRAESVTRNDWITSKLKMETRGEDFIEQFRADILTIFKHLLEKKVEQGDFVYGKTRTTKNSLLFIEGNELKERRFRHHHKQSVCFTYADDAHYARSIDDNFYALVMKALKETEEFRRTREGKIRSIIDSTVVSSRDINVVSYYEDYADMLMEVTVKSIKVMLTGTYLNVIVCCKDADGRERNKEIDGQVFFINNETIYSEIKALVDETRNKINMVRENLEKEIEQSRAEFDKLYKGILLAKEV